MLHHVYNRCLSGREEQRSAHYMPVYVSSCDAVPDAITCSYRVKMPFSLHRRHPLRMQIPHSELRALSQLRQSTLLLFRALIFTSEQHIHRYITHHTADCTRRYAYTFISFAVPAIYKHYNYAIFSRFHNYISFCTLVLLFLPFQA